MAIYHLNARTGTRGNGQSARAKSEYIEREGRYAGKDGQKKADVLIVSSGNMPKWALNHRDYWKAADQYERSNGRLYKEIEFALPAELSSEEMRRVAQNFVEYLTEKERLPYTFAIHINDPENPHCHLMVSERANDGLSRSSDVWFSRADSKRPEKGGAKKTTSLMPKEWLLDARAAWGRIANESLERAGSEERIDHRTLEAQGIDREPTTHRGVHGEAKKTHREIQRLEAELSEAKTDLIELEEAEKESRAAILPNWAEHFTPPSEAERRETTEALQKTAIERQATEAPEKSQKALEAALKKLHGKELHELYSQSWKGKGRLLNLERMLPPIGATEIATPERRPSVSDEATAAAKVPSSAAEPGETLEPKAAVEVPLVVPPERKRPLLAAANVTPTDGEAKRTLTSGPKPKAAVESAPMTAKERRNGQTTPRPEPELSEREYRIQAIARMVAEEQKELHQKFDAAYAKVKELKAAEPRGLLEILRESEDHKKWREEIAQAVEAQNRAWKACGGDLTAPNQGKAEVKRRLTPEYALEMAKKIVMDEEQEERQKARIKERQQQAALQDTVELKAGSKVTCHTIEPFSESRTFPAEIIKTSAESIKVRDGGKELTLRRENCYFTDLSVPDQNPKPEVPQVSKEDESIQKEALRMREREKEKQRERSLGYGDVER